jgi:hypothetical protein
MVALLKNGLCGYCNDKMERDKYFINYDDSIWFLNEYFVIEKDKK